MCKKCEAKTEPKAEYFVLYDEDLVARFETLGEAKFYVEKDIEDGGVADDFVVLAVVARYGMEPSYTLKEIEL